MNVHGARRILTFDARDFARSSDSQFGSGYPAFVIQFRSAGGKRSSNWSMPRQRDWRSRGAVRRSRILSLAKTCSIGLSSGE
jgi:hypothetical protein